MNPTFIDTRESANGRLQLFFWMHPEWWTVAICGFAWVAMLFHAWQHAAHGSHHFVPLASETGYWMLMVAAMMLPLTLASVRVTANGSLWSRRHRAIAGFLAGYFVPWLVLGIVVAALRAASWTHTYSAASLAFVVAALWQRTSVHAKFLIDCHRRPPLAPAGWQADRDCLRFGAFIGVVCVGSCWPLMVACTFAEHGFVAMTGGMAIGAFERFPYRPRTTAMLVGTLALAGYYGLRAVLD